MKVRRKFASLSRELSHEINAAPLPSLHPRCGTRHVAVQVALDAAQSLDRAQWTYSAQPIPCQEEQTYPISASTTSLWLSGGGIVNQIKILSCTNDILPDAGIMKAWRAMTWCYMQGYWKNWPYMCSCIATEFSNGGWRKCVCMEGLSSTRACERSAWVTYHLNIRHGSKAGDKDVGFDLCNRPCSRTIGLRIRHSNVFQNKIEIYSSRKTVFNVYP